MKKKLIDTHTEIPLTATNLNELKLDDLYFAMHEIAVRTEKLRNLDLPITGNCFYTDTEYNVTAFLCSETAARFDQPVYCYRLGVNGQSVSLDGIRKHYQDMIRVSLAVIEMHRRYLTPLEGTKTLILRNYVNHIILFAIYGILSLKDRRLSRKELVQYEKMLKSRFPEEYRLSGQRRFLFVARRLCYRPFSVMRRFARTKFA